jgi:hypothetical protein
MAADRDQWADDLSAEHSGGWLTNFLADEDTLDRRALWRLGSWGAGAVGAVVVAVLASQSAVQLKREQSASADMLVRQSQQIQFVAKETQAEAKRLSSAIDTLNSDRDRLYARVTSVEQNLESVTGSIKRQAAIVASAAQSASKPQPAPEPAPTPPQAAAPSSPVAAPFIGPVASATPVEPAPAKPPAPTPLPPPAVFETPVPLMASKSMMAPPDPAAPKFSEPSSPVVPPGPETTATVPPAEPEPAKAEVASIPVQRTEFGIDLGGANSIDGLRALWRGLTASHKALAGLRPVIMLKERTNGLGMQLRLVAGPIGDAAAAAKLCAGLTESQRSCETSLFEGQRLALKNEPPVAAPAAAKPAPAVPAAQRRRSPRPEQRSERPVIPPPAVEPPPEPKPQPSLTSFLGLR